MKRKLITFGVIIILMALGYYLYEMWGFAEGVQEDTKRRNEFINKQNSDSIYSHDTVVKTN